MQQLIVLIQAATLCAVARGLLFKHMKELEALRTLELVNATQLIKAAEKLRKAEQQGTGVQIGRARKGRK